jgi:uncharacterized SAM-binding protein YcdF (DUF218 family)
MKGILRYFIKIVKGTLLFLGAVFLLMIVLSFTSVPFWAINHLATANSAIGGKPDYIVVMGAGAMPGAGGLMRCHYAAQAAVVWPEAKILITMPAAPGAFLGSDPYKMYEEIARFGIAGNRFVFETRGTDTHSQACAIHEILNAKTHKNLLIVSSPAHIYRSILSFEKCGFAHVDGLPAFQASLANDLLLTEKETKEGAPLARSISLRYDVWNYFKLQVDFMREVLALAYYKVKGYI